MRAYVAVTERDWYEFFASRADVDRVNFWLPEPWEGEFRLLDRGEPLLFRLRAPVNVIVGGGFFERYGTLRVSRAWRKFGEMNGAPTLEAVRDRITRLRHEDTPWWYDSDIGCILLAEPFFWPEELWISHPSDWKAEIGRGKTYDLSTGPGENLWEAVIDRLDRTREDPDGPDDVDDS